VRGLQAAPFYGTLSTKDSREHAGRWAKAIYYAAGETSTAICSIAVLAVTRVRQTPLTRSARRKPSDSYSPRAW